MIEIGDFVPTFELRDQCGRQCFSGADLFSGDPRAYLFCPAGAGELTDTVARAFVDAADALRRAGGWAFLIMAEPDAVVGQFSGRDLDPVRLLSDPSGETFGAVSLPLTTLVDGQPQVVAIVLNANAQVDSTWVSADLEELVEPVLERLGDLAYRPHPVAAGANPPVLIIPGVVDTELCRVLVELWQKPVPVYRKGEGEANPEAMANATTDFKVETDSHVVLPIDTTIRILVASNDVIHAWAVPAFGIKLDAVPGQVNETWVRINRPGTYYGQCSEICGTGHSYMPIKIVAVSKADFESWVEQAKEEFARVDEPDRGVRLAEAASPVPASAD